MSFNRGYNNKGGALKFSCYPQEFSSAKLWHCACVTEKDFLGACCRPAPTFEIGYQDTQISSKRPKPLSNLVHKQPKIRVIEHHFFIRLGPRGCGGDGGCCGGADGGSRCGRQNIHGCNDSVQPEQVDPKASETAQKSERTEWVLHSAST